ncbi:DNA-binding protein H-NS [Paraburkholderia sp. GAS199]|uniref:H-NS histone family protein n=1 Tax=Paraburkholderia sp. GAS199 TaxID=3035126 RepID=UPI003D26219F
MATVSQIEKQIANLQKKADDLRRKKAASVILKIKKMMAEHGLSLTDLEEETGALRKKARHANLESGSRPAKATAGKSKLPPKYRDPVSGATWSGHARPPAWIKDAKDRSKFLIEPASQSADTVKPPRD